MGDLLGPSHIFILIIHWDFVTEFLYFAFFGAFLLGLLYLNFSVGLFMDTLWTFPSVAFILDLLTILFLGHLARTVS